MSTCNCMIQVACDKCRDWKRKVIHNQLIDGIMVGYSPAKRFRLKLVRSVKNYINKVRRKLQ
jgi:hypothetical protein